MSSDGQGKYHTLFRAAATVAGSGQTVRIEPQNGGHVPLFWRFGITLES